MRRGFLGLVAGLAMVLGMSYAATPPREPARPAPLNGRLLRTKPKKDGLAAAHKNRARKLARNARLAGYRP